MSGSQFIPRMPPTQPREADVAHESKADRVATWLLRVVQGLVIAGFALTPLAFMSGLYASLGFDKVVFVLGCGLLALVLLSFNALRSVRVHTVLPVTLGLYWLFVGVALISALISGDTFDALRGSALAVQTVGFLATLGLAMTLPLVFQKAKKMTLVALVSFGVTASLLLTYNLLRLFFGPEFLSFGSFHAVTVSPIGGFNDLGIFAGLAIIFGLVTLVQLPLRPLMQYVITGLIVVSLCLLAVINFFSVWLVVGFFGLLLLLYLVTRDTLLAREDTASGNTPSRPLVLATTLVCITSAVFIIGGDFAGNAVAKKIQVNHVEIIPSFTATVDVARAVYAENPLFGVGPNRFADAWRLHKDPSINDTIFWDTDFNAGSGYVPTLFVTTGLLGGLAVVMFHLWFLWLGYRMFLWSRVKDSYWYYLGVVSFTSACYLWGLSYVYSPGAALLLLGGFFTGFTFVAASALLPRTSRTVPLMVTRQRGFVLMAVVILVVAGVSMVVISTGRQYVAEVTFAKAQATPGSVADFDRVATASFDLFPDDRFVLANAQSKLNQLNALLNVPTPTEEDHQNFVSIVEQTNILLEQALLEDDTNPDTYAMLAGMYGNLAIAGVDGAQDRARVALKEAQKLDPKNPSYYFMSAQLAVRTNNLDEARDELAEALALKANFTEALFLLAQLDIAAGNTTSAIATTRSIILLEPRNPTRYLQLGILLAADENFAEAIAAYQTAIRLDSQYANARYLLALAYVAATQPDLALEQLRIVLQTNPDNVELQDLIGRLQRGEAAVVPELGLDMPMLEMLPSNDFEDVVTSDAMVDDSLFTPINPMSGDAPYATSSRTVE